MNAGLAHTVVYQAVIFPWSFIALMFSAVVLGCGRFVRIATALECLSLDQGVRFWVAVNVRYAF